MSQALVNRDALDELSAVIGAEKLARIVDRFLHTLASAVAEGDRTAALRDLGAVIPCADQSAITASSGASKVRTAPSGG